MDSQTRHWYLQQMGIPVWLPKEDPAAENGSAEGARGAVPAKASQQAQAGQSKSGLQTRPEVSAAAAEVAGGLSPAQQIAQALRDGAAAGLTPQSGAQAASSASTAAGGSGHLPTVTESAALFWLVMPNVAAADRAAAEALLDKVLAAVSVDKQQCQLIWGMPEQLPPASVKHLWCFGLQVPSTVSAQSLALPSLSEMLSNVDAKRAAWNALKAAMPFAS